MSTKLVEIISFERKVSVCRSHPTVVTASPWSWGTPVRPLGPGPSRSTSRLDSAPHDPADTLDLAEVAGRVLDPDDAPRRRAARAGRRVPTLLGGGDAGVQGGPDRVAEGLPRRGGGRVPCAARSTVPVVLAAAPGHAALADLQLRVVLDALGRPPAGAVARRRAEPGRRGRRARRRTGAERHLAVLRAVRDTLRVPGPAVVVSAYAAHDESVVESRADHPRRVPRGVPRPRGPGGRGDRSGRPGDPSG